MFSFQVVRETTKFGKQAVSIQPIDIKGIPKLGNFWGRNIFTGIKVLDLSRLLSGLFCSMLLADMGADVIKVEDPKVEELHLLVAPETLNRNKLSFTLNLKAPEGKEILRECNPI